MPIYEYECRRCSRRLEIMRRMSDPPLTECPECGGELRKLVSAPAFQFKGSGWYVTDYAKKGSEGGKAGESKEGEAKGGESRAGEAKGGEAGGESKGGEGKGGDAKPVESKAPAKEGSSAPAGGGAGTGSSSDKG
jgi:putative FmdB family regulatory protein